MYLRLEDRLNWFTMNSQPKSNVQYGRGPGRDTCSGYFDPHAPVREVRRRAFLPNEGPMTGNNYFFRCRRTRWMLRKRDLPS